MDQTFQWAGRYDGDSANHLRIHQIINQTDHPEFILIGFCSDEGVKRNKGRIGAASAPNEIRKQLANLPVHQQMSITDLGNIVCENGELEKAQKELAEQICTQLSKGIQPVILGGGHEIAFGSFSGLFSYIRKFEPNKKIGIINFDAHFDLREEDQATSGTPFLQAAKLSAQHDQIFHYLCIGVGKHANTKILFETADQLNVQYILDQEIYNENLSEVFFKIDSFLAQVDEVYLTIDIDAFPAYLAPGVSAPAVKGIDLNHFERMFKRIKKTQKVRLLDIAECNPIYDQDHITAKLAAYIIYQYIFD